MCKCECAECRVSDANAGNCIMTLWRQVTSLEVLVVANETSAGLSCLFFARTNVLCVEVLRLM